MAAGALAEPYSSPALPTLALNPAPEPSMWTGLYVGSEVTAISRKGAGGLIGGGGYAGYDRAFANGIVLGVQGGAGYLPAWFGGQGFKGVDYGRADVKVGYDMGRLMPFVTAGVLLARPHLGPGAGYLGSDSVNTLMNGPGELQAVGRIGVGATYEITNNLSIGVAVSAVNGRGVLGP